MPDIFVNYRHDDGWAAGRLKDRLESEFDVFIDTGLRPGASLEGEIMPELDRARIILAVISKEWLQPTNLARLQDESDWIRRELLRAFARKDALVIPVLADVPMPKRAQLPEALYPLIALKAFAIRYDSWQEDIDIVIERLGELLDKPIRPVATAAVAAMPPDLPYLCDRAEQERGLTALTASAGSQKSLVCVLHGHRWEAHLGFLNRLRQKRVLEKLFAAERTGVDVYQLQWTPGEVEGGQHGQVLRSALKEVAMDQPLATDDELYAYLRNPVRPAVMMLQVTQGDLQECGPGLLAAFEQAWQQLIAKLGATPCRFLALWLNLTYDSLPANLADGLAVAPLKQLNPVQERDILSWMALPEVTAFTSRHESALTGLAADQSLWMAPGKIHMQRFVDAVRALIPGN